MLVILLLVVFGLVFGSFINALVWRVHEQSLNVRKKDAKNNPSLSILSGRSMCPNCKHTLASYDLIPVFSWLWLKGKCRYCHKSISPQYPIIELLNMILFVVSYLVWPYGFNDLGIFIFILWLLILVGFVSLSIYDLRWLILPNKIVYPLISIAIIEVLLSAFQSSNFSNVLLSAGGGVIVISGLFYLLFQMSGGKWIGGGDVKLGIILGLLASAPLDSLFILFIASTLGTLFMLPSVAAGKADKNTHLPFGPFLIIGGIIVFLFGASINRFILGI